MRVKLKRTWFAPSDVRHPNKLFSMSGGRYKRGEHEIPDEYKAFLPSDALIILEPDQAVKVDSPEMTLKDFDEARTAAEETDKAEAQANLARKNLAKARETKARKALEKAAVREEREAAVAKSEEETK